MAAGVRGGEAAATLATAWESGSVSHFCRANAPARPEARIAFDDKLVRFPAWWVVLTDAELGPTPTVRGWELMPAEAG